MELCKSKEGYLISNLKPILLHKRKIYDVTITASLSYKYSCISLTLLPLYGALHHHCSLDHIESGELKASNSASVINKKNEANEAQQARAIDLARSTVMMTKSLNNHAWATVDESAKSARYDGKRIV